MTLLVIVISLFLERVWPSVSEVRSFAWFDRLATRVQDKAQRQHWSGTVAVAAALILPLFAVAIVHALLADALTLLGFAFAVAVLLYSLGPRDLDVDVHDFLNAWEQGDEMHARNAARRINEFSGSGTDVGREVVEGILVAAHERWFGAIFWFVILGPLGALWYRLACLLRANCAREEEGSTFNEAVLLMHHILAWVPTRLTILGYALAGSFADALEAWRHEAYGWRRNWLVNNRQLLIRSGLGALQLEQELSVSESRLVDARIVRAALGLALRTLVLAVALIAAVTLGIWVA